jgi:hypothetical protein
MSILRWTAVALALIAIVDPRVSWPGREGAVVRVVAGADEAARQRLMDRLRTEGFTPAADGEAATIATADAARGLPLPSRPFYIVGDGGTAPDVSVLGASASGPRVAQQAVAVAFTVRAHGGAGATTTVRLEDGGLSVASASYRWTAADETWRGTLSYLPFGTGPVRLRVRADTLPGERRTDDNAVDLLAPAMRAPLRTLVIESGVTYPAAFVRRALEAAPGFAVAAVQHATKTVATRAGSPPRAFTRADLAPYEVVIVGQPASLDAAGLDALTWFVERRGGVAVLVPDQAPPSTLGDLFGGLAFDSKTLETPIALSGMGGGLMAAELAVPRALPPLVWPLASDPAGTPVVFAMRRGLGALIVSGALDAWRYRDRNDGAFARFWPAAVLQQAGAVPPHVEVNGVPRLVRPGDTVRVTVRLREMDVPADAGHLVMPSVSVRAVDPASRTETSIRVWPSAEPGVFEGEWRPVAAADYLLDASIGAAGAPGGSAIVRVAADAVTSRDDGETAAIAARATGGAVVNGPDDLVRALHDRFPSRSVMRPSHPARSVWYASAFVLLLCGEWVLRRRRGLP